MLWWLVYFKQYIISFHLIPICSHVVHPQIRIFPCVRAHVCAWLRHQIVRACVHTYANTQEQGRDILQLNNDLWTKAPKKLYISGRQARVKIFCSWVQHTMNFLMNGYGYVSKLHCHINLVLFHCDEQKCKYIFHMNKTLLALCINHCIDIFISIYTNINVDLHRPSNCSCMHKLWITSIELYNFTISFNLLVHASIFFPKHVTYFSESWI